MKRKDPFYVSTYNLVLGNFDDIKCYYRYDPVPCTGKHSRYRYCLKKPKTTQEKRMSFAVDKKYVRGKRNFHYLPNSYDDIERSDIQNKRGWKKSKIKKQWMKRLITAKKYTY